MRSDPTLRDGGSSGRIDPLEHGQRAAVDLEDLVGFSADTENVSNPALCDRMRECIAESMENGEFLLAPNTQCLVQVAAGREDVGDASLRYSVRSRVTELGEHRHLLLLANAKRFVEFTAFFQQIRHATAHDCKASRVIDLPKRVLSLHTTPFRVLKVPQRLTIVADLNNQVEVDDRTPRPVRFEVVTPIRDSVGASGRHRRVRPGVGVLRRADFATHARARPSPPGPSQAHPPKTRALRRPW